MEVFNNIHRKFQQLEDNQDGSFENYKDMKDNQDYESGYESNSSSGDEDNFISRTATSGSPKRKRGRPKKSEFDLKSSSSSHAAPKHVYKKKKTDNINNSNNNNISNAINYTDEDHKLERKKSSSSQSPPTLTGDIRERPSTKEHKEKDGGLSVRSIPCFYANCTYSYKRPGSLLVEISDRPLILPSPKFDKYTIRSCKKHHDKWRHADLDNEKNDLVCEVCRGLNATDSNDHHKYSNSHHHLTVTLCNHCSHKQSNMLGIKPIADKINRQKAESDEDVNGNSDEHENEMEDDEHSNSKVYEEEDQNEEQEQEQENDDGEDETKNESSQNPPIVLVTSTDSIQKDDEQNDTKSNAKQHKKGNHKKRKSTQQAQPINYIIYKHASVDGWTNVGEDIAYTSSCIWDSAVKPDEDHDNNSDNNNNSSSNNNNNNNNVQTIEDANPYRFSIRKVDDKEVGLFAETVIEELQSIGEYVGKVIERKKGSRDHTFSITKDLEIDSSQNANEISLINSESSSKDANVRFDIIKGRVFAVTLRKIEIGEELIGDYVNSEYRDRENSYLEIFARIEDFNQKHLTEEERTISAFQWFLEGGYELLKAKAKITVPIGNRIPSKKGLASNLAPKRYSHINKDQGEWGYVAQYEMLDMERAREDCWVTFKAGKNLSWDDLEQAITTWKSDPTRVFADSKISFKLKEKEVEKSASASASVSHHRSERDRDRDFHPNPQSHTNSPLRERANNKIDKLITPKRKQKVEVLPDLTDKEYKVKREPPVFLKEHINQKVRSQERDIANQMHPTPSRCIDMFKKYNVQEIQPKEIKFDAEKGILGTGKYGFIFKGFWRGYPVAIRFPYPYMTLSDDPKEKLLSHCSNLVISHPNITQFYGVCQKEQTCMIMEYMNLGNLKRYLMSLTLNSQPHNYQYQFHGMYIPRIALDVARGMEFLHSRNVIHRNLKSSNVLMKGELLDNGLVANMEIKLSDFGMETDSLHFSSKDMKDLDYMHYFAPEVLENRRYSYQSDVFSFGMILCHLFSEGQERPKPPNVVLQTSHHLQVWDPKWKDLITRCTHTDPSRRPSFADILDIVFELLTNASRDFMQ